MKKKIIIFLLFSIFLNQCGFNSIYSNNIKTDFTIENITFNGDDTINRYLNVYLDKLKNDNISKKFDLKVNTRYKKNVLSKDKTAKVTDYQLLAEVSFDVIQEDVVLKQITITEKKNMENVSDELEEEKLERIIKQNFASTISNRLINELMLINVN